MKKITFLAKLCILFTIAVHAQTNVSGVINTDTTWSLVNSPYQVNGGVLVSSGVSLTIEPGVVINFSDDYKILVKGSVNSSGTNSSFITFNGNSELGNNPMLIFKSTNLSNSTITYTKFSGLQKAIQLADESEYNQDNIKNSGILKVTHCDFDNAGVYTKGYETSAELKLEDSTFDNVTIRGYYPRSESITFTNCTINNSIINSDAYNYGIKLYNSKVLNSSFTIGCCGANFLLDNSIVYNSSFSDYESSYDVVINSSFIIDSPINLGSGSVTINNSIVSFNGNEIPVGVHTRQATISNSFISGNGAGTAISVYPFSSYYPNTISNSNVSNNSVGILVDGIADVYAISGSNLHQNLSYSIHNNSNKEVGASGNYWGTTNASEIQNLIFDSNDDVDKGTVGHTPFLNSLNTDAPISPPSNVTKTATGSDVVLHWEANMESDVAGYKLYFGSPTGYSYATTVDLGNVTTYTIAGGDINMEYAITAYDSNLDGNNDMPDGNESWYAVADRINVPPSLADIIASTEEDVSLDIELNASDPDSNQITYRVASYPTNGTVNIINNKAWYTPSYNFNGTDSFTVIANDGEADSNTATISLSITPINDAPVANSDILSVAEGDTVTLLQNGENSLLHNDTDIENDALTVSLVSNPSYGSLTLNSDGTFSYEHDGSDVTSDSFYYKTSDGSLESGETRVDIYIQPVNDNLPSDITLSNNSILENRSYSYIGDLIPTDADLPNDGHTFELVDGNGDDNNSDFTIMYERYLYSNTSFDYEAQETLSIRLRVTDQNNQSFEKVFEINVINENDIQITSEVTNSYCSNTSGSGEIHITNVTNSSGELTYSWYASNGGVIPVGQEGSPDLTDLPSGFYYVTITDDYFSYYGSFEISLVPQYSALSICRVSSDDTDVTKNRIYLNNQGNYNVAFYEILRESNIANVFTTIGTIPATEDSFLDETSNNESQSYNYKVRLIDNCGTTSPSSDYHKTILLQSSIAVDGTVNLNWSDYEGVGFDTYKIFRSENQGAFEMIGSVSANSTSYNDTNANVSDSSYKYYISIEVDACLIETTGTSEIRSNLQNIGSSLSVDDLVSGTQVSIYPNPASLNLHVTLSRDMSFIKGEVYNTIGQKVIETKEKVFSVQDLPSSTYFLRIFTSKGTTSKTFIKK